MGEQIAQVFVAKEPLDQAKLDELEEMLIEADLGPHSAARITERFAAEKFGKDVDEAEIREALSVAIGDELSTRSELFRRRWASHDVTFHRSGQKRLRHPVVGQLDLDFEGMELASSPGLHLNVYTAASGTPTADALKLLASWAASQERLPTETAAAAG